MKTSKILVALFVSVLTTSTQAQEQSPAKVREYGLGLNSFKNYTLQYRWGTEKKLKRISGNIDFSNSSTSSVSENVSFGSSGLLSGNSNKESQPLFLAAGLNVGVLHLKPLTEKFGFFYGPSLSASVDNSKTHVNIPGGIGASGQYYMYLGNEKKTGFNLALGATIGVSYKVNSSFFIYAEISPQAQCRYEVTDSHYVSDNENSGYFESRTDGTAFSYGLKGVSTTNAMVTLAYRVTK